MNFLYDIEGREITQVSSTGAWTRGEVYAGGRHLATYTGTGGSTYFIHEDWLGTERGRSAVNGTSAETCTSLPFGDSLTCSGTDLSPMHLTGKEHDWETGLENFGARYDSSSIGRFMSPDEAGRRLLTNPQSWNAYVYVLNNPLTMIDPDGREAEMAGVYQVGWVLYPIYQTWEHSYVEGLLAGMASALGFQSDRPTQFPSVFGNLPVRITPRTLLAGAEGLTPGVAQSSIEDIGQVGIFASFEDVQDKNDDGEVDRSLTIAHIWLGPASSVASVIYSTSIQMTIGDPVSQFSFVSNFRSRTDKQVSALSVAFRQNGFNELAYEAEVELGRRALAKRRKKEEAGKKDPFALPGDQD